MNENNFRADQYLLHYGHHQSLQSTDPFLNAVNAEMCDATRRKQSYKGSRRTMPTTHLNANPSNFRDLVQKFTGRSARVDNSLRRKGPVTLDFSAPASVPKEFIFPSSGDLQNCDRAIDRHVSDEESHATLESRETVSYEMGTQSESELYGGCDDHAHGNYVEDDDLLRDYYLENSSCNGVQYVDYGDFYHDAVLLEEFMMRDFDI
ncbi:unnamed protein product [Microthlaspi erraticum]|uniref:VQ domain-containing protein n=1 Tax=Microthlaspi erraticum TaxID=1685480 RepID=A0A6D2HP32_9BRAS|nr:unnamed protein product [Microthlaspi erraticum]